MKKLRWNSIGSRLFIYVLGAALVCLSGVSLLLYKQIIEKEVESNIKQALNLEVSQIDSELKKTEQYAIDLAGATKILAQQGIKSPEAYKQLAFQFYLKRPKLIFAVGVGQTPYQIVPDRQWYFPYFYADQKAEGQKGKRLPAPYENTFYSELAADDDYFKQDYYKIPAKEGKSIWLEPYLAYGWTLTTFATGVFNDRGQLIGILNADLNLTSLTRQVSKSVIRKSGYFAIVSQDGKLLAYPPDVNKAIARKSYATVPEIKAIWSRVQQNRTGLVKAENTGSYWAYQHIPSTNWVMLATVDEWVVLRPIVLITVGGVVGSAVLLGIAVGVFVRRLNNRLQPILDECSKLAAVDVQLQRQMEKQDEVNRLKTSFFNLLEQIAAKEKEIRQEVAQTVEAKQHLMQATEAQKEGEALAAEVSDILDVVSAVQDGDLTVQAQVSQRITGLVADTLNRLIEELAQILAQVLETTRQVSNRAFNLEQIASIVALGAKQQAHSVKEVLNLSEQVEQSAVGATSQVQTTNQSLLALSKAVRLGQEAQVNLHQGIEVLQLGSERIVKQMKTLGEFVGLAEQFVQSQSDIAQQTQVLALNAALVAARAAGQRNPRTFAVVAREFEGIAEQIGKLAEQTNRGLTALEQHTNHIHTVVSAIDAEVQNLGGLVGEFTQGVEQSSKLFNNVQTVTAESILSGEAVARSSQEILLATVATATAMRDIANLAQQTAQLTQNSLSQSEAMGELSKQLLQRVEFFRLPINVLPQGDSPVKVEQQQ